MVREAARHESTPLTDPRSLGGSLGLHLLVLGVLSTLALSMAVPRAATEEGLVVELPSVDNRVRLEQDDQGGGPGELGGVGAPVVVKMADPVETPRDPALEAYLAQADPAEALPDPRSTDAPPDAARGVGVTAGPGLGGGGGTGGGSGGGIGRGVGPGAEFFGVRAPGRSFAFVIDRSGSMSNYRKLETAKRELLESLELLAPNTRFCVIFYNQEPHPIRSRRGQSGLVAADADARRWVEQQLPALTATGGTNHSQALRAGLATGAEVVFFLTDGQLLTPTDGARLEREAGSTRVQVIEFGVGPDSGVANPSRSLALATGGQYRYLDVLRFRELLDQPRARAR